MPDTCSSIALSINLNKIALIRNSREGDNPKLIEFAYRCIELGCNGITVHPRPDQRHIRPEDCVDLASLIAEKYGDSSSDIEFNIEGNPFTAATARLREDFQDFPGFVSIIEACKPDQVTLVPDSETQLTSDHGFDLREGTESLEKIIAGFKNDGRRVSLFMDPDLDNISRARDIGADRIELYTGPFASAYADSSAAAKDVFKQHCKAAEHAFNCGLAVNAGHDLNLENLTLYRELPHLSEVSIGHALVVDALHLGLEETVSQYKSILTL